MCIFLLLHFLGVLYIRPTARIFGWQWMVLLTIEIFVIISLLDWTTKRFGHFGRHRHPRPANDQDTWEEKHGG
jgi:hypothetical protein